MKNTHVNTLQLPTPQLQPLHHLRKRELSPLPLLSVLPYWVNDAVYVTPVGLVVALVEVEVALVLEEVVAFVLEVPAVVPPAEPGRH